MKHIHLPKLAEFSCSVICSVIFLEQEKRGCKLERRERLTGELPHRFQSSETNFSFFGMAPDPIEEL